MASRVQAVLTLTDVEKKDLLAVLGSIDADTRAVFGLEITDQQWSSVPNISSLVAYQGFDPVKIITEFMRKGASSPKGDLQSFSVGDSTVGVYSGTDPKTDLLFFLTLFVTRGNNVAKILLKCDTAAKDIINRKCSQYGISTTSRVGTSPLGPSVITLARLSQAFAPATASIIIGHSVVGNLKSKLFVGITLPLIMTHTIFSALLREEDTELIEIAKYLNLEMSVMLSTPKEKRKLMVMSLQELLEQSESYVMAAVNGSITAASVKTKALIKANILSSDTGSPTQAVQAMITICGRLSSMSHESYSGAARKMAQSMGSIDPN